MRADNVQSAIRCCIMAIADQRGNGGPYRLRIPWSEFSVWVQIPPALFACHAIILNLVAYHCLPGSPVSGGLFLMLRQALQTEKRRLTAKHYGF